MTCAPVARSRATIAAPVDTATVPRSATGSTDGEPIGDGCAVGGVVGGTGDAEGWRALAVSGDQAGRLMPRTGTSVRSPDPSAFTTISFCPSPTQCVRGPIHASCLPSLDQAAEPNQPLTQQPGIDATSIGPEPSGAATHNTASYWSGAAPVDGAGSRSSVT